MKVTPKTEEEVSTNKLCPEGDFQFEVVKATEKTSKSGNEMIEIVLKVWANDGEEYMVYDYLMDKVAYKIKHFCEATNLSDKYNKGIVTDQDCEYKTGMVRIKHQKDNRDTSIMRHTVKDYLLSKGDKESDEFDGGDDIPF